MTVTILPEPCGKSLWPDWKPSPICGAWRSNGTQVRCDSCTTLAQRMSDGWDFASTGGVYYTPTEAAWLRMSAILALNITMAALLCAAEARGKATACDWFLGDRMDGRTDVECEACHAPEGVACSCAADGQAAYEELDHLMT